MNKEQRHQMRLQGIEPLRAQYNPRKGMWRIVKYTITGGWAMFGASTGYQDKAAAEDAIERLCKAMPSMYVKD